MSAEHTLLVPQLWRRRIAAVAVTGALALSGVAVAEANGPGAPEMDPAVASQSAPEGTPVGPPDGVPGGPPDGAGQQSEHGGGPPEDVGRPDLTELLPDQASPQAHAALAAVVERHEAIRERLDDLREIDATGAERGEAVSELAKEFGEQMKEIAAALTDEIADLGEEDDDDDE